MNLVLYKASLSHSMFAHLSQTDMGISRKALNMVGRALNEVLSFFVFSFLDFIDVILCVVYKSVDFFIEAEWKPCYCSSSPKNAVTSSGKILVSERGGESKILSVCPTKLELDDISDTLYKRSSVVSDISISRMKSLEKTLICDHYNDQHKSPFKINTTFVGMLQGKMDGLSSVPRWSDCDCKTCYSWSSSVSRDTLFVHTQGPKENPKEDVLFIHGFISSSTFWTETLFPKFSARTKSSHRLMAVDLLGFGKSPKPDDSLYTLREHVEMIERSTIEPYKMQSFHIVAHSLGCILALAIAVKYPKAIKSLTLLAPPYFSVPEGEQATQYVMRRIAPRRVWPLIAFGASMACWYEHVSRTICLLICKNHRLWEFIIKFITRNRIKTYLIDGFMCHTHNSAWHTLHNIICGTAGKMDTYLEEIRDRLTCDINIFHGRDDELLPVECSHSVQSKVPRAFVKIVENKDHVTLVVGRQKAFARELEEIWNKSSSQKVEMGV